MEIPSGTVTFLFTDIQGSTQMWEHQPEAMGKALRKHDAILRSAIQGHSGYVFKTVGDAFCASFPTALEALSAAVDIQKQTQFEDWGKTPIRIRIAIHTGEAEEREGDYFGRTVNRVARLEAAGHGGQILVSSVTQELLSDTIPKDIELKDLGIRRLKDLERPEHIFQVIIPRCIKDFPPLKTIDIRPNNLPFQVTSFVGREKEIEEIRELLKATRLLTVAGPGGIGKTRVSLHAATELLDVFSHGIWFIDLVKAAGQDSVWQTIAASLSIRAESNTPMERIVIDYIENKELLIILDNCEHLVEKASEAAEQLLASCPNINILATSREALGIAGETIYQIQPLSVPNTEISKTIGDVSDLTAYESVRLFIDRALQVHQNFTVTNENAPALAQICMWLDGIPLAIELAASRVKVFSLSELHKHLGNRFKVLTKGLRTAPPRQQTLKALIDWSYNLLNEEERDLFEKLSVFSGGWDLKAAEAVCDIQQHLSLEDPPNWVDWIDPEHNHSYETVFNGSVLNTVEKEGLHESYPEEENSEADILLTLERLVDKSLVVPEEDEGTTRFHMFETIRQYAEQKHLKQREAKVISIRHMVYYMLLVEGISQEVLWERRGLWNTEYDREYPNIRTALEKSLRDSQYYPIGCRIVSSLFSFWSYYGMIVEGSKWVDRLYEYIRRIHQPHLQVWSGLRCGFIYLNSFRFNEARTLFETTKEIALESGFNGAVAGTQLGLGILLLNTGENLTQAEEYLGQAGDFFLASNRLRSYHVALLNVSSIHMKRGNLEKARELLMQIISEEEKTERKWIYHMALNSYAWINCLKGNYLEARDAAEKCLESVKDFNDRSVEFELRHTYATAAIGMDEMKEGLNLIIHSLQRIDKDENKFIFVHLKALEGFALLKQGNNEMAFTSFKVSCQILRDSSFTEEDKLLALIGVLCCLLKRGEPEVAGKLIGLIDHSLKDKMFLLPAFIRDLYFAAREELPIQREEANHLSMEEVVTIVCPSDQH